MVAGSKVEELALSALAERDRALAALDSGDAEEAAIAAEQGLAILNSAGLGDGLDAVAVLVALAEINEALGQFTAARETAERAVAIAESFRADDEPDTVMLWCQAHERLAGLERVDGDFAAAVARLATVLDRASTIFGEDSHQVASAANALGVVYKYWSRFDEAEAAYRRAMAALESGPVEPDPVVLAGLLHNLGGLAHSRGRPKEGIVWAERGLGLRTEALGGDHPDTGRDLNALGALYEQARRAKDAARAYKRALAIFEACYGPDHFEVAMVCANVAVLTAGRGDNMEAELLGRRALTILEQVLGPDDAEVGLTLLNLGVAVADQGRTGEAISLLARAEAILSAALPAGHPHLETTKEALASLQARR